MGIVATNADIISTTSILTRTGVFGGSFDPFHQAHLALVKAAKQRFCLDEVQILPCGNPPHREPMVADAKHRLQMAELAVKEETGLNVDGWELSQSSVSYTYKTLEHFSDSGSQLFLVLGRDSLNGFLTWKHWARILGLANLIVAGRPGAGDRALPTELKKRCLSDCALDTEGSGKIYFLEQEELECSSSEIRSAIAQGREPTDMLHPAVWQYIVDNGLYQNERS